jgi:outer membrane lipopolysaccharide assembly protein LptE/RlpB
MMRRLHTAPPRAALLVATVMALGGCGYYTFTGASIPEHLGTIAVPLVIDESVSTVTSLEDTMTSLLLDRFVQQTRLSLEQDENRADAVLRARIVRYTNQPTSITGNEQASRNRVSIAVQVVYTDRVREQELLNRSFSSFEDSETLTPSLEEQAAAAALEKIADDIFTAATSNW